jgi:hypothetical protein
VIFATTDHDVRQEWELLAHFPDAVEWLAHRLRYARYMIAWHPSQRAALLRLKDPVGRSEWSARQWRYFSGKPTIADVTADIARLVVQLHALGRPVALYDNPDLSPPDSATIVVDTTSPHPSLRACLVSDVPDLGDRYYRPRELAPDVLPASRLWRTRVAEPDPITRHRVHDLILSALGPLPEPGTFVALYARTWEQHSMFDPTGAPILAGGRN